jgi:hypothetical protein
MLFQPTARHIFQQPHISSPRPRAKPTQHVRLPANDKDNNREPVDIPIDLTEFHQRATHLLGRLVTWLAHLRANVLTRGRIGRVTGQVELI